MLTPAQLATLRAAILAETNPTAVAARDARADNALADWYNGPSNVDAWSESADARALDEGADYSAFDSVVAGKRAAWDLFLRYAPRDMSRTKNRKVVTDVWGNATAASVAESILQASRVKASRFEVVFAGATTNTGTVSAIKRDVLGPVSVDDISRALNG